MSLRIVHRGRFFRAMLCVVIAAIPLRAACAQHTLSCALEYRVVRAVSDTPLLTWQDSNTVNAGSAINARIGAGSYGSASVVVRASAANNDCNAVDIAATDLVSSDGVVIGAPNVRIRYVKQWFQGGSAWQELSPAGTPKLIPELLLNDPSLVKVDLAKKRNYLKLIRNNAADYVDISTADNLPSGTQMPANTTYYVRDAAARQPWLPSTALQQLWITVDVPESTRAGNYRGAILMSHDANAIVQIPISIDVLPFTLPEPAIEYSIFYRGQLLKGEGTVSSDYKNEQQYRAELRDMKRHGISNPNVYQELPNHGLLDAALRIRREEGFTDARLYYLGLSASTAVDSATRAKLNGDLAQLKSIAGRYGYTDVYLFGIDEAKGNRQRRQLASWKAVHDAGARVFATGHEGSFDNIGDAADLFVMAFEPKRSEISRFQQAGRRVFTYAYPQTAVENPALYRRNYGLKLWIAGADGAMPYAYMAASGYPWNDFDNREWRDHQLVYPTVDGVVGTLAWEGFHEAVEDVRYLTALEQMIKRYQGDVKCADDNCTRTLALASEYLRALRTSSGDIDLDLMRGQLADYLVTLQARPEPPHDLSVFQ